MLLAVVCNQQLLSQPLNSSGEEFNIGTIREELYIRTDRDIYITGEQVWFKIYNLNSLSHAPWDISKVVYFELLDKNNFPVKQLKINIDGSSGSSAFRLPEDLSSGNFVIRAYTNRMKNWPADMFFSKTISVINPFNNIDHLQLSSYSRTANTPDSLHYFLPSGEAGKNLRMKSVINDGKENIKYTITVEKKEYSSRENVKMVISATDIAGNPIESDLSVSVVKSVLISAYDNATINGFDSKDPFTDSVVPESYLAELEGHLISGVMRSKITGEPIKKTDISLGFLGKKASCQFSKTDENGEFNFIVKESGLREIVIQPLFPNLYEYYIELNQPFSNEFGKFIPETLNIDTGIIAGLDNAVVSMQINNIYEPFRQKRAGVPIRESPDFFGKADNTILMSDYIELTSVREVVKEIIPNVYTLKQNGKYDFKLINKLRGQSFENSPLVLVDGIPIYDIEKVLNINSNEIEKVEITNTRYFFSENVFDGIVSFITKKGNLSAFDFDNSIFRQVYELYQSQIDFYSPDYSTVELKESKIPDFRNTLYWKPDLHTGIDGKTEIGFCTSDESERYTILVEGISPDGKTGFSTTSFIVK